MLLAVIALLSRRPVASSFVAGGLLVLLIAILIGQWRLALGTIIIVPLSALAAMRIKTLHERSH